MQSFEITGTVWVSRDGQAARECHSVVTYSSLGIETWLYVDKETSELVLAAEMKGAWRDLDLEDARERFADVLYCI